MTSGGLASIHHQHVAVDIGGSVRCKEDRRAFQVMVGTETTCRNVAEQVISLVFNDFVRHVRGKPSWRNSVDLDIMPSPLDRKIVGEGDYSTLAGVIRNCLNCFRRRAPDPRD